MEKILLAVDASRLNKVSLEFACYLAKLTKSKVTGIFLENLVTEEKPVLKKTSGMVYLDWKIDERTEACKRKLQLTEKNISLFKESCIKEEVCYEVHRDKGLPETDLLQETRFADLLITDATLNFAAHYAETPSSFVKDILSKSECPVVVAPDRFQPVDEMIFLYNGSAAALFALKQFTYLFPQLGNKKITILQVNEAGSWQDPDKFKLKEWLKNHYTDLHFEAQTGNIDNILFDSLFDRKNIFLIMGAYGRSAISVFFKPSHADRLIKKIPHPLFIAHW